MGETSKTYKTFVGKLLGIRPLGGTRRWRGNIKMNLMLTAFKDQRGMTVVLEMKNLRVLVR
jgi:hypothetical protein